MKIVIDDNIPYIKGRLEPVADTLYVDQFGFTPENVRDADAIVIRTRTLCNESLLGHSRVRLIATATIGMDQIDIPWCAERGISGLQRTGRGPVCLERTSARRFRPGPSHFGGGRMRQCRRHSGRMGTSARHTGSGQ